ncbi:glycosyltransferase family 61 protein [Acidisoma sp. 7E03]
MNSLEITPAGLPELLGDSERSAAQIDFVEDVSPGGRYSRRSPVAMDVTELEPDQQDLLASYLAHEIQEYGPLRHVVLRDAIVTGQGSVVTANHRLVRESAAEFLAHGVTPTNFQSTGEARLSINLEGVRRIETPALLVKRPWYRNYGHWLVDGAALLSLAWKLELPADWQIVIGDLGPCALRSVVHQTTSALAPGIVMVEHRDDEIWQFDELHYVSPLSVPPLYKSPESLSYLRAAFLHSQLSKIQSHPGFFITRGASSVRRLVNEDNIASICERSGLSVLAPESVSLADQARLFRSARVIVGVKGASLTNALFCKSSARVVALSPGDFPDPFFWDLVAQHDVGYSEIFGSIAQRSLRQGSNAFSVDPTKFSRLLELSMALA